MHKALRALRFVTTTQLSLQLGGEQSDANYLLNSAHPLRLDEWVPSFGGPGTPAAPGDTSGFAIRDTVDFWTPNPTNVACPDFTLVNPGFDAATCYFWGDTVQNPTNPPAGQLDFQVSAHALYLTNLEDENTWRWEFGFPAFSGIELISGFPNLAVGTCFTSIGHRFITTNPYTSFLGVNPPGADQFTLNQMCPYRIETQGGFSFQFTFDD